MKLRSFGRRKKPFIISLAIVVIVILGLVIWQQLKKPQPAAHAKSAASHVVTSKPVAPKPTTPGTSAQTNQLQQIINSWAASAQPIQYAISVRQLGGPMLNASYRATTQMTTASTYKIYVAYAMLYGIERGSFSMNQVTAGGPTDTVSYCLQQMILISDNDCSEDLMSLYGFAKLTAFIQAQGFTSTNIDNYDQAGNMTSANKVSTANDELNFLYRLQAGQLLNSQDTNYLLQLMEKQQLRQSIPAGVPAGITVADKPGWLANVETDAAIVYGKNSTYLLVILSNGSTEKPLANLSKIIYDYLENGVIDPINTQAS